ncbi:MAG: patatin-like phospholipase family protein [Eubacteriales bacterium]
MGLRIEPNTRYGLVLEGGGAKGAYHIGVWKALRELNIPIQGVTGTSVGALNGALICMDAFEEALNIWENITYSQIMDVKDDMIESIRKADIKTINFIEVLKDIRKFIFNGGIDISPLKQLIKELLDEELIRQSTKDFGLVTVSVSDLKPLEIFLEDIPKGQLIDFLIASSYFPFFKKEKINGKRFIDGGFRNNLPVNMLIDKGYNNIIVVRIYGIGIEKRVKIDDKTNIIEIAPTEDLGGLLEFSQDKSKYNIKLGYFDTLKIIKGLEGNKYYINMVNDEKYYLQKLINLSDNTKNSLRNMLNTDLFFNRGLFEYIIPNIAKRIDINIKRNWDYKDFIIHLLEYVALRLRIDRFKVYTDTELIEIIKQLTKQYENKINENFRPNKLRDILLQLVNEL